jgi:hypothetical protein
VDPRFIGPDQWGQVSRLLLYLVLFAALALDAAFAFLLGQAIVPSLVENELAPPPLGRLRWLYLPLFALALALTGYALARALLLAVLLIQQLYPRFAL